MWQTALENALNTTAYAVPCFGEKLSTTSETKVFQTIGTRTGQLFIVYMKTNDVRVCEGNDEGESGWREVRESGWR